MDELRAAFDAVKAEESLKTSVKEYLSAYPSGRRVQARHLVPAVLCLILLLGAVWVYYTPVAQISVEINPCINLTMNRFERVIRAEAGNPDGEAVLENLNLQHMLGVRAVENILCQPTVTELLEKGEMLSVGIIGEDNAQTEHLLTQMEDCVGAVQHSECYYATPEEQQQAQAAGMSCGKYRKMQHLQALHSELTADEVQDMSMGQLHRHIEALENASETQEDHSRNHGNGHGKGAGGNNGEGHRHGKE